MYIHLFKIIFQNVLFFIIGKSILAKLILLLGKYETKEKEKRGNQSKLD